MGLSSRLSKRGVKANALASDSYSRSLGSLYGVKGASKASLGLGNKTKTSERGSLASRVRAVKPEVGDRIIASVPYLLPLMDGVRYGRYFFQEFPQFYALLAPLQPLLKAYYTLPFAGLIVFFALYYGVVQNYNLSRFVRYNAMQSILLDILLIIPSLLENFVLRGVPKTGAYLQVTVSFYNFVWLYVLICFLYGVGSCLAGEQARLPGVADAADRQVM